MSDLLPQSMNTPAALALMILGFGLLIFVHELGHFLAAKLVGIKVTQFAIGFGRPLLAWRKGIGLRLRSTEPEFLRRIDEYLRSTGQAPAGPDRPDSSILWSDAQIDQATHHLGLGETEYRINWLPLGGYVKMLGQEDLDPSARSDYFRAFNQKPAWARALVIVAGVSMNLLVGLGLFILAFLHGVDLNPPLVGLVNPDSPAARAFPLGHENDPSFQGLRPGDRILRIDGQSPTDFLDISIATALARPDQPLQVLVQRPGLDQPLLFSIQPQRSPHTGMLAIGIAPPSDLSLAYLPENDPAYAPLIRAGLHHGARIIAIDNQPVQNFADLYQYLSSAAGRPLSFTFHDPLSGRSATVTLRARPLLTSTSSSQDPPHLLGLSPVTQITAVDRLDSPFSSSPTVRLRRFLYRLGLDLRSPAEKAGLQPGDLIAQLGSTPWPRPDQVPSIVRSAQRRPLALSVWRENQLVHLSPVTPNHRGMIGISLIPCPQPFIGTTLPGSPAATLHLPPGSRLLAINSQPVTDWADIQHLLQQIASDPSNSRLELTFQLNLPGSPQETLSLELEEPHRSRLAAARWAPPILELLEPLRQTYRASTPWQACRMGLHKTRQFVIQTYLMLARLIQGSVPVDNLYGPVGILQAGTQIARDSGWSPFLFFLGLLSVNLAVLNLLPLPIVDGGLLLFLLIEKIKGSPVSPAIQNAVNYLGLALLAAIFLMVTYFDIMRWF